MSSTPLNPFIQITQKKHSQLNIFDGKMLSAKRFDVGKQNCSVHKRKISNFSSYEKRNRVVGARMMEFHKAKCQVNNNKCSKLLSI